MKKIIQTILCVLTLSSPLPSFSQGLQVNPPGATTKNSVAIPHAVYPASFFFNEPQILSIDLNETGKKIVKLQQVAGVSTLEVIDVASQKISDIKVGSISRASKVFFLTDEIIALEVQNENTLYEIIDWASNKMVSTINANHFIGSTSIFAYFSNENGSSTSIEKFDLTTKKSLAAGRIAGEVFGWYFSKAKGIVGVAVHSNMLSKIYSFENDELGESRFEFSSGYYFETKGCNSSGDVFYGITNFQSLTSYVCAITKNGIKPLNNKSGESCTDVFVEGGNVALTTNNINTAEYQESTNSTLQKILTFAHEGFKGSSVHICDFPENTNTVLFSLQSEVMKPQYFLWQNNQAKPMSSDKYDSKNLTFIPSEIVQIKTGEFAPQTGRIYIPTLNNKSNYPLVIYIPQNIFLPYRNEFNPTVQYLCQSGYAVFVWNTRFSFRPKIGFSYADLVGSLPEDLGLVIETLKKEYSILKAPLFLLGEGLGGYLAITSSASSSFPCSGVIMNRLEYPGKKYSQDLNAVRMFGEDAQSNLTTLDRLAISPKVNYLNFSHSKSNAETRLIYTAKQNKVNWTEQSSIPNESVIITSQELDDLSIWLKRFSQIDTRVIEDKPKVEVKTK